MPDHSETLSRKLGEVAPAISQQVNGLTASWLEPLINAGTPVSPHDKHFNDPIWGTITLYPWETALLDTPLIQRLRGVKQNGLAHLVFSTSTHDRFSHACGVVEATERILESLNRNSAARVRAIGPTTDSIEIPLADRYLIRLAALIHDAGHGPFSHAIEPLIERLYSQDFKNVRKQLSSYFSNVGTVSVSETIAIMMVASPSFRAVLALPLMAKVTDGLPIEDVQARLIGAIAGGSDGSVRGCLGGVISNQIDADKLDYMARDAHHSGLPLDFDTHRLIAKMEFLTVEAANLTPRLARLAQRAQQFHPPRYHEIGIAYGGTGAFEQMLIGRVLLYDRIYHHHKVRTADAMAQRLVYYSTPSGQGLNLENLYVPFSDDAMIRAFGGSLRGSGEFEAIHFPVTDESRDLSKAILGRRLYKRAFAFAGRFIAGLDKEQNQSDRDRAPDEGNAEGDEDAERRRVFDRVNRDLADFDARIGAEREITELAIEIGRCFPSEHELHKASLNLKPHHVIVDLPRSPYPARITTIVRMEDGRLDVPDLFYDPARWAEVYNIQRRTGYVFTDSSYVTLVALSSRIWFLRKYGCVLERSSHYFSKTNDIIIDDWYDVLIANNKLMQREKDYLSRPRLVYGKFSLEPIHIPGGWREADPNFRDSFNQKFNGILDRGVSALAEQDLRAALRMIFRFVQTRSEDSEFCTGVLQNEAELQRILRQSLRDQSLNVDEGTKRAGGTTDLVVERRVVIENKLLQEPTDDPFGEVPRAALQGRRYVLPTGQQFVITVVGYRSATEQGKLSPHNCVRVQPIPNLDIPFAEIRVVVRFGDTVPSRAQ